MFRRTRLPRSWLGIALLLAVGLISTSCSSGDVGGSPTVAGTVGTTPAVRTANSASYASAPCPNPALPGHPQFDLGPKFTCGYLTVPENRSKQHGPTIRLLTARLKALSPTPAADPIVWLTGGAGSPIIADAN